MAVDDALSAVATDSATRIITFAELTGNDSKGPANEAGQTLTVSDVTNAVGGTVAIVNGDVEFTPGRGLHRHGSFDYTVTDDGTTDGVAAPLSATGDVSFEVGAIALDLDANDSAGDPATITRSW